MVKLILAPRFLLIVKFILTCSNEGNIPRAEFQLPEVLGKNKLGFCK